MVKSSKRKRNSLTFHHQEIDPPIKKLPKIVSVAAARYNMEMDWTIFTIPKPARHTLIREELEQLGQTEFQIKNHWEMGFLTDEGNFLNCRQALALVEENGQIEKGKNDSPSGLISDDLW